MPQFIGTTGPDSIVGTAGDDLIDGRTSPTAGSDTLLGLAGDDAIQAVVRIQDHGVVDSLDGGDGDDTLTLTTEYSFNLARATLQGGAGDDTLSLAQSNANFSTTLQAGYVTLDGGAGSDVVQITDNGVRQLGHLTFLNDEKLILDGSDQYILSVEQVAAVHGNISIRPAPHSTTPGFLAFSSAGTVDLSATSDSGLYLVVAPGIDLTATSLADRIEVYGSTYGSAPETVHAGSGDDDIDIDGSNIASDLIFGEAGDDSIFSAGFGDTYPFRPLTIDGGDGTDALTIDRAFDGGTVNLADATTAQGLSLPDGTSIRDVEGLILTVFGAGNTVHVGDRASTVTLISTGSPSTLYSGAGDDALSADVVYETPGGTDYVTAPQMGFGNVDTNTPKLIIDYASASAPVHMANFETTTTYQQYTGSSTTFVVYTVHDEAWVGGRADSDQGAIAKVSFYEGAEVFGSSFNDTLQADRHPASLFVTFNPSGTGDFTETLHGGAGDDTLEAGLTGSQLDGGTGDDTVVFDYGHALASYSHVGDTLVVTGPYGADILTGVEHLQFADGVYAASTDGPPPAPSPGVSLTGGAGGETLIGGSGPDTIEGGGGADTISGGGGDDTLNAGDPGDYGVVPGSTAVYAGRSLVYQVYASSHYEAGLGPVTTAVVAGGDEGGVDTLRAVADLRFLDGTLTFDAADPAAQIYRLYDTFLNRAPDVAGFDAFQSYLASGHTLDEAAAIAGSAPEFLAATAALSNADYVVYLYENTVSRAPDGYGLQQYTALLDGGESRADLALQISEGAEHVQDTSPGVDAGLWKPDVPASGLALLYDAVLQREPDAYGLAAYESELASGVSFRQIANQAVNSPEFQARYGGMTDKQFIDALYLNTVHRAADPFGEAAYVQELGHGYSRGDVIWQVSISPEHEAYVLSHPDPSLFIF